MTYRHESSCSVHNMPAYEAGPCDCKYRELNSHWDLFVRLSEADQRRWWNQYTLYGTVFIHEDEDGNVSGFMSRRLTKFSTRPLKPAC